MTGLAVALRAIAEELHRHGTPFALVGGLAVSVRTLLGAYPIAGLESMPAFAERAGVSAPTVIRFVGKLGYEGYGEFQRDLRTEVQARITGPLALYEQAPVASHGDGSLLQQAKVRFAATLAGTFDELPEAELVRAAELLADVRRPAHCIGGRFSHLLARHLYAHLYHLRPGAVFVDPGLRPLADALVDVGKRHVVVVFDYRRYQDDVVAFARGAAARGADVVLFTDPWMSPVSDVAEAVLPARVEAPSPYDSLVGGLALVETLVASLVARLGEPARRRVEELERLRGASPDAGERA